MTRTRATATGSTAYTAPQRLAVEKPGNAGDQRVVELHAIA